MAKDTTAVITIPQLNLGKMRVRIEGLSPLITHHMGEKARKMLLATLQNKKTKTREAKDPEAEFNAARYRIDENGIFAKEGADAIPGYALKEAMVEAARHIQGLSMTAMRQLIFVELGRDGVPIQNGKGVFGIDLEPEMEESIQRQGGKGKGTGAPTPRFRPIYRDWAAEFDVQYNSDLVGEEEVINLINYAGFHSGLCEHRPSKSGGQNGMFRVAGVIG